MEKAWLAILKSNKQSIHFLIIYVTHGITLITNVTFGYMSFNLIRLIFPSTMSYAITKQNVEKKIFIIRGKSIMIDSDLALLYGVTTKRLNEQVKRNKRRFPEDFMFRLTKKEKQEVVAICDHLQKLVFSPVLPYVFTEPGVAMLSSVLNSEKAIRVNIQIIRTFIKLREFISTHKELAYKLNQLENKIGKHDEEIQTIFQAIRQLTTAPGSSKKRRVGFVID